MGLLVTAAEPVHRDMGVQLGRGKAGVPEYFLYSPEVGTTVQEMRGSAVSEGVWP